MINFRSLSHHSGKALDVRETVCSSAFSSAVLYGDPRISKQVNWTYATDSFLTVPVHAQLTV